MALPARIVLKLGEEGILSPTDLLEFGTTLMFEIADNPRRPGERVVDPNNISVTIEAPTFVFGSQSQQQLITACNIIRF